MDYGQQQESNGLDLAPQACSSCRKQKRKCDKLLPACSLCRRIGRACDYSLDTQASLPTPEDFVALRDQVAHLEQLLRSSAQNGGSTNGSGSNSTSHTSYSNASSNASINLSNSNSPLAGMIPQGQLARNPGNTSSFPSIFFLDSNAFEYERSTIQAPYVRVPLGALVALGGSTDLRAMIEQYFATVHNYFAIISKIRLYQHLANPLHEPGADIALLFLAMKLVCSEIPEGLPPQTQLYLDIKNFYHYVEGQNLFSIHLIQALSLVALYELGHSIYPAAFLTIGNAARLGHAMGLHDRNAPQMLPRCNTWTEQEERRRVWWGIVILDRMVSIGNRGKPMATANPSLDTHLPTDDSSWDRGIMLVAAPLSLSTSPTIRVSPFARSCQAAHLLGKVLQHIDDKHIPVEYRFSEAIQLHRTGRALADVLADDVANESATEDTNPTYQPSLYASLAMTYSALLTLYDAYSCTGSNRHADDNNTASEERLQMQGHCLEGLRDLTQRVTDLARKVKQIIDTKTLSVISPMVIDSIYQAAANYAWYVRESSDRACSETLHEMKDLLSLLDRRWKVAGQYLYVLAQFWERIDDMYLVPARQADGSETGAAA